MDASGIDPVTGYWRMRGVYSPTRQQYLSTPRVITDANGQEWAVAPGGNRHVRTGRRFMPGQGAALQPPPGASSFGPDVEASDVIPPEPPTSSGGLGAMLDGLDWKSLALVAMLGYIIIRRA
jgi:hypothetical protein